MRRTNLFLKVVVEHDDHDDQDQPERLGREICRQVMKIYGVRSAELANFTRVEE